MSEYTYFIVPNPPSAEELEESAGTVPRANLAGTECILKIPADNAPDYLAKYQSYDKAGIRAAIAAGGWQP